MTKPEDAPTAAVGSPFERPVGRLCPKRDHFDGQWGTSDAPDNCTECGTEWANGERLHTGDDKGIGGWEDWMHCSACGCEMFFPVTHRHETPNADLSGRTRSD